MGGLTLVLKISFILIVILMIATFSNCGKILKTTIPVNGNKSMFIDKLAAKFLNIKNAVQRLNVNGSI